MTVAQLARRGIASVLVERAEPAGLGVAYATLDSAHLLNVPAGNMSAWADVPDDFARRTGNPAEFAQRREFGAYLGSILDEAVSTGCAAVMKGSAVSAQRDELGWAIGIEGQEPILADAVVLAVGNQPPGRLAALDGAANRLISNPWSAAARKAIDDSAANDAPIMIVGTGLTMVDVVLSLDAQGHRGPILALSRRGLIPRGHSAYAPAPVDISAVPQGNARKLLSWLRGRSAEVGWRAAVDSLRPHSRVLWQSLEIREQRRFLRHARPWWDVHRHRIAPQVAALLVDMVASGRLEVTAGRLQSCQGVDGAVEVTFRRRSRADEHTGRFAYLFNCTGPLHSIARSADPLLSGLIENGQARADNLGIGLAVDDASRVQGSQRLWAVGPLTKGAFWEIVAVPDIRGQAAAVADDIARELA